MKKHGWVLGVLWCLSMAGAGCGSAQEEEFEYGEADMRQVVVGSWTGSLSLQGAAPTTFDMTIDQAPPSAQPTCENRTFPTPACMSMTTMDLDATLTSADGTFTDTKLAGSFTVYGLKLDVGELALQGGGVSFSAQYDDAFGNGIVSGAQEGSFTLQKK